MTSGEKTRGHGVHVLECALRWALPLDWFQWGWNVVLSLRPWGLSLRLLREMTGSPRSGIHEGGGRFVVGHKHQLEEFSYVHRNGLQGFLSCQCR